jgi:alcohol dehydrogenase class IV
MNAPTSTALKALCLGGALALISGCASTNAVEDEMAQLRAQLSQVQSAAAAASNQASEARFMAEKAMDAARTANNCCTANTERMERMFKKSMSK